MRRFYWIGDNAFTGSLPRHLPAMGRELNFDVNQVTTL